MTKPAIAKHRLNKNNNRVRGLPPVLGTAASIDPPIKEPAQPIDPLIRRPIPNNNFFIIMLLLSIYLGCNHFTYIIGQYQQYQQINIQE